MTLPLLFARPQTGRHPAAIVLPPLPIAESVAQLRRRLEHLAAHGEMAVAPLRVGRGESGLQAVRNYLRRHPAVLGEPRVLVIQPVNTSSRQ